MARLKLVHNRKESKRSPQCEAIGQNGMGHPRRCILDLDHDGPHRVVTF